MGVKCCFISLNGQPHCCFFYHQSYTTFRAPTKEGGQDTQQGCLIPFAKIREMVCPRLDAGNALSGGGKLSEKQRLYVGGVTDSRLVCSTPDTGESSAWTCCGTATAAQNNNIHIKPTQLWFLSDDLLSNRGSTLCFFLPTCLFGQVLPKSTCPV